MKKESYFGSLVRVAAATGLPFALIGTFLFAAMTNLTLADLLLPGIAAGALFGLFFGVYYVPKYRYQRVILPISGARTSLREQLGVALAEIGYRHDHTSSDMEVFKSSIRNGFLARPITVSLGENETAVVGPAQYIRWLAERFGGTHHTSA